MDLLTKEEFEAGFGSHTPIFSGQTKCVRYHMNFGRGLALLKEVIAEVRLPCGEYFFKAMHSSPRRMLPGWHPAALETLSHGRMSLQSSICALLAAPDDVRLQQKRMQALSSAGRVQRRKP